ncbi:VCBS repeat-containing protein [Patescibacteria group bacterium]|nr:VCBS repeat-containing protein [Patescibacteria group bacterium]
MPFLSIKKFIVLVGLIGLIFVLLFIKNISIADAAVVAWTAKSAWNAPDVGLTSVPAFADLDNDGDYDLLIGADDGISYAYENTGSNIAPVWTAKSAWNAPDVGDEATPAFADLDNDGDYDLLIGEHDGTSAAYENTGSKTSPIWTAKGAWSVPDVGFMVRPAFADLDNDGDYDLMIGGNNNGGIIGVSFAYENTGSNINPIWTAKPAWDAPNVADLAAPAFADLDNDGDYDLLIGKYDGTSNAYENTGSKTSPAWTYKSDWNIPDVGFYARPAFADLDNDGDYDLLIGSSGGTSAAYENTGSPPPPSCSNLSCQAANTVLPCACGGATVTYAWNIQTVDSAGIVGQQTSLALDSSGNPHISYRDLTNEDLKYAKWTGAAWNIQTVDSAGIVGNRLSIALDSSNNPHIGYSNATSNDLKYAKWTGAAWNIQTVDSADSTGYYPSLALGSSGNPHIIYTNRTILRLKYAKWTGAAWNIQTMNDMGGPTSLALDSSNNPHISYYNDPFDEEGATEDLKYAKWTGAAWNIQTVESIGNVGYFSSLALDSSGNPHISYQNLTNGDLKYAKWTGAAWNIQTVDSSADNVGGYPSLALDSSNNPHISYQDSTNGDLKYAKWTGAAWNIQTVDSAGNVGQQTSLALDSSGNPHISYYDVTNGDLKYASFAAANPWCCAGNNAVYNTQALCQVGVCVACVPTCATGPGCRAAALANAGVTGAVCCGGKSCYQCNTGYSWNGSSCAVVAPPPPAVLPLKPVKVKLMAVIISGLINGLLALAAGLAILFLIIGGIRYIRSWGDSEQTEKAKKMISYVVLGLVIILISYSVIITLDKIING